MDRDMSLNDMLNRFLFVILGSRVIDWQKIGSGNYVYSLSELRNWLGKDKVDAWLHHRDCKAFDALEQAIKFAYDWDLATSEYRKVDEFVDMPAALVEMVSIDVDAMIENQIKHLQVEQAKIQSHFKHTFHLLDAAKKAGWGPAQLALLDPPPTSPKKIETLKWRLEDAIERRDAARQEYEQMYAEAVARRARRRAEVAQDTDSGPS